MNEKVTRVGIGVLVFKNGKFLLGQRKNAHGKGDWCPPGGHLEFGESFEDTAQREVLEETGIKIKNIRFGAATNDFFEKEGKHYVTILMLSDWSKGQESILEPDKFVDIQWRDFDDLPEPLFLPFRQVINSQFIDRIKEESKASTVR